MPERLTLEVRPRGDGVVRVLVPGTALVSVAGVVAEVAFYVFGADPRATELFSLSYEGNVPTWYASTLLAAAGGLLWVVAAGVRRRGEADGARWALLSAIFFYMSLDEAIEIHEYLVYLVPFETGGALYYAWVLPGLAIVLVVGFFYLPFLRRLPADSRRRFVIAGALFVGGALGMELPLGWWTSQAGSDNLTYGIIDWVEETLELAGATYFVIALLRHLEGTMPSTTGSRERDG